jgi:hypothetical protein
VMNPDVVGPRQGPLHGVQGFSRTG